MSHGMLFVSRVKKVSSVLILYINSDIKLKTEKEKSIKTGGKFW